MSYEYQSNSRGRRNQNRSYRGGGGRGRGANNDSRSYPNTANVQQMQMASMNPWMHPAMNAMPNLSSLSEQQAQALLYQQEYERQYLMHQIAMCEMMAAQENPFLNPMHQPTPDLQRGMASGHYGMPPPPPVSQYNVAQTEEEDYSQCVEQFDREVQEAIEREYEKQCDLGNDIDSDHGGEEAPDAGEIPDDEEYLQFIQKDQEEKPNVVAQEQNLPTPTPTESSATASTKETSEKVGTSGTSE